MTLAYTDVLPSSDSPFEPQKGLHFIFDIVIGIQSHHHSSLHIMSFSPYFKPLIWPHVWNYPEGISKIKEEGLETRSILKEGCKFTFLRKTNTLIKVLGKKKDCQYFCKIKKKGLPAGDSTLVPQIELSMVKMEGFSSPFCLSDKALVGVMELVQPIGVILTVDCLAINFLLFISQSLLSSVV